MRVFCDLDLVEHLGSGIPRIIEKYSPQVFTISDNYLRVTFFYHDDFNIQGKSSGKGSGKSSGKSSEFILSILKKSPRSTVPEIAENIGISTRAVEKQIKKLRESGKLLRKGGRKTGHWEILEI